MAFLLLPWISLSASRSGSPRRGCAGWGAASFLAPELPLARTPLHTAPLPAQLDAPCIVHFVHPGTSSVRPQTGPFRRRRKGINSRWSGRNEWRLSAWRRALRPDLHPVGSSPPLQACGGESPCLPLLQPGPTAVGLLHIWALPLPPPPGRPSPLH